MPSSPSMPPAPVVQETACNEPGLAARPLRADAERNRQLILRVAAEVFAEQGLDAGFDEIARRAGIGVGTVYRRFPDRNDLVAALFEQLMAQVTELAEAALLMPNAWEALCSFFERTLEMQAQDRGLREVMARATHAADQLKSARERLAPTVDQLIDRAKREGGLRHDVLPTDLAVVLTMISSAVTTAEPQLWRRYLSLFLDSLRDSRTSTTPLPLSAPSDQDVTELVQGQSRRARSLHSSSASS